MSDKATSLGCNLYLTSIKEPVHMSIKLTDKPSAVIMWEFVAVINEAEVSKPGRFSFVYFTLYHI